jgi:hypothetical protein
MKRRSLLTLTAWLSLGATTSGCASSAPPSFRVSAEQLQEALARRFPVRYQVRGLFDLNVQAPRLHLLPDLNRISSEMAVEAAGPALRRSYTGEFDLDFALRYESAACPRKPRLCWRAMARRWRSSLSGKSCCTA